MPVAYNNSKIVPAPFATITKNYIRNGAGEKIGSTFQIVLTGTILPCKGSPTTAGSFNTGSGYLADESVSTAQSLGAILQKQDALRGLFAEDGASLEIQPLDGSQPMRCYPTVQSIEFPAGSPTSWAQKCDYTITLEATDIIGYPGKEDDWDYFVTNTEESYSIEENDTPGGPDDNNQHTFRVTHTISATGKVYFDEGTQEKEPWEYARDWVMDKAGFDTDFVYNTDGLELDNGLGFYNKVRTTETNEEAGTFSLTETALLSRNNYIEDFTINSTKESESNITRYSIEGTITGLETRNESNYGGAVTSSKYDTAKAAFDALWQEGADSNGFWTRVNNAFIGDNSPNVKIQNYTISTNEVSGVITYTIEYDDSQPNCFSNTISEVFVVSDNNPTDVFASIAIIGKTGGPLLQDMDTVTAFTRSVNIELVMESDDTQRCPSSSSGAAAIINAAPKSQCDAVKNAFKTQLEGEYDQVFVSEDNDNWNYSERRYSRNFTLTASNC